MENVSLKFKTRIAKGGEAFTTNATFDFTNVTEAQVQALAMRTLVIIQQSNYRAAEKVETTDHIYVAELLKRQPGGFVATPESLVKKIKAMTPEQQALIRNLLKINK